MESPRVRRAAVVCVLISATLHALLFLGAQPAAAGEQLELKIPDMVEFGLLEDDPGQSGSPKPAAAPPEPVAPPEPIARRPKPAPASVRDPDAIPLDRAVPDAGPPAATDSETAAAAPADESSTEG